jgi:heat shock protein HslJ
MNLARIWVGVMLFLVWVGVMSVAQESGATTVTGKLERAMAIGAESTGWTIHLDGPITVDGKPVDSIELSGVPKKAEKLANQHVKIVGKLSHRHGVERGDYPILEVSSIKKAKGSAPGTATQMGAFSLAGSEWRLEDLAGSGVVDNIQATLAFPEAGRVAGNGACNRFFGSAEISGDTIKLGPLASSRMACPEAVMNQEMKYLSALQAAERFEWKDPYLLVYCKGFEKPLRFTRVLASNHPAQ